MGPRISRIVALLPPLRFRLCICPYLPSSIAFDSKLSNNFMFIRICRRNDGADGVRLPPPCRPSITNDPLFSITAGASAKESLTDEEPVDASFHPMATNFYVYLFLFSGFFVVTGSTLGRSIHPFIHPSRGHVTTRTA